LQKNTELPTRSFYKYLTRIKKFFFQNAENDLFLIGNDPRKINNPKFQERLKLEKQFQNLYNSISNRLKELNISRGTVLPEQYTKETLNNLKLFKELAENILNAPLLKGFKGK